MRFVLCRFSVIFICAAAFAQGPPPQHVNPHTQIRWPVACASQGMTYSYQTNTCLKVGPVGGGAGEVQFNMSGTWNSVPGFTYDPNSNTLSAPNLAVPGTANIHIPPSGVQWPPACSGGVYVPATNTCVAPGTAANPAGNPQEVQWNAGGAFGSDPNYTFNPATHNVAVTSMNGLLSVTAVPDLRTFSNATIAQGSTALTSSNAAFTSADNGKLITIPMGTQGVKTTTYVSGGTATGITGQTCVLSGINGGGTGADAFIILTGTNTIANGTITFTQYGTGYTSPPTSATLVNGSATCSGTVTLSGSSYYVWPVTTTMTFVDATHATLGAPATTAVSGTITGAWIGTNNTPAIQGIVNTSHSNAACVTIPPGNYALATPVLLTGNECVSGWNGTITSARGTTLYPVTAAFATPDPAVVGSFTQYQNITLRDFFIQGGINGIDLGLSHFVIVDRVSCQDQSGWCFSHVRGERHRLENIQCFHINVAGAGCISVADATHSIYANSFTIPGAISNVSLTGNVATFTYAPTPSGYFARPGATITVAGLTNTALNGTWTVVSGLATSFTAAINHADILSTADSGTASYAWNDLWWDKSVIERVSDQGADNYLLWSNAGGPGTQPGSFSNSRVNYLMGIASGVATNAKSVVRMWSVQFSNFSDIAGDNIRASGAAFFDVNGFFNGSRLTNLSTVSPGNFYANGAYFHNDFQFSTMSDSYVGGDNVSFTGVHFGTTSSVNGSVQNIKGSIFSDGANLPIKNHINVVGGSVFATNMLGGINLTDQNNNDASIFLAADQLGATAATSSFKVTHVTAVAQYKTTFQVNAHGPGAPGTGIMNLPPIASNAAPVNGDVYTKSTGLFAWINGAEVGPLGSGCVNNCTFTGTTSLTGNAALTTASSVISWNADLGLSRIAAGTLAVGNGTTSDTSGQVRAALFRLTNSGFLNTVSTNALTASVSTVLPNGTSATVMAAALVTTAAASDTVTMQGMTSTGHCSLTATNAAAATNIATSFISAKAANQITVTHTATAAMNYDVLCTPN